MVTSNTEIARLEHRVKIISRIRNKQQQVFDKLKIQKTKKFDEVTKENEQFLEMMRSSRGFLDKNTQSQLNYKMNRANTLQGLNTTKFGEDWHQLKLLTKERSSYRQMGSVKELSNLSLAFIRQIDQSRSLTATGFSGGFIRSKSMSNLKNKKDEVQVRIKTENSVSVSKRRR